ncbi:MAG TPA: glycosyltransferase family 4 protein, partial [Longimicrobiales bacterium]|nr:glycosyltransferase family 4 protein [Longimicrobiales bacterium]
MTARFAAGAEEGARPPGSGAPAPTGSALRILVVNWLDRENPQAGGAETHLHEVFGRMARGGDRVTLLCSGWRGSEPRAELDGIHVHRVGGRYTFSFHARRYFRRHLAPAGFDVIVEDLNKVPLFTPRWSDIPVVLLVHHLFGVTAFQEANPALAGATWLLERPVPWIFRSVRTVAISESTRQDLVRRGLAPERITVIPNGIDVGRYRPDPSRRRFPEPTLLFVGRIKRYKRIELVVQAVAELRDRGLDVRLVVAGKGDHMGELVRQRDRLGLADRIEFLGFVDDERKRELFRHAWVHVLTSPKEGWGISNLEAAACGTPTVSSDSPGLRESVRDGETGFLVPHGDVPALADRIARLVRDPGLRDDMGRAARSFAEGFSWEASSRRVRTVLAEEARGIRRPRRTRSP